MATHETQSERITHESAEREANSGKSDLVTNLVSNLIILGGFVSFAVALVGFLIGHHATLVVGALLLAIVAFIWAIAAAAALYKIAVGSFTGRRLSRRERQSE